MHGVARLSVHVYALSVFLVGALAEVGVARQHVVVHVDGAAVVDGVAESLSEHLARRVERQTQLEETRLGRGQPVLSLEHGNAGG